MKTAKIIDISLKHIVTMINFNWECMICKKENVSSLSEEEDLMQHKQVIQTCHNCRTNNRINVSDIYSFQK
jgi:transcription elongation factor Elf1